MSMSAPRRRRRRLLLMALAVFAAAALGLASCADVAYYRQAVNGHWQLLEQRRNLDEVLADTAAADLHERLRIAGEIRDFASHTLGLPDNASYRSYVDTGRRHVVYNIFAAPSLSLQAKTWCFPMVGCVGYRGYFNPVAAERYAARLREQGYDVYVGGVPAYSTLGWFDDPLLNTFVNWPPTRLAELIFHELAHQQLYVEDDTVFNESFATAVGQLGTELWLAEDEEGHEGYRRYRSYRDDFLALVGAYKKSLNALYFSAVSREVKRAEKQRLFAELRSRYREIKRERWGGYSGYDRWFEQDLNNAKLAAFGAYADYVPAFLALFEVVGRDFAAFYRQAAALGALRPAERLRRLQALAPADPPETVVPLTRQPGAEQPRHHALDRGRGDAEFG